MGQGKALRKSEVPIFIRRKFLINSRLNQRQNFKKRCELLRQIDILDGESGLYFVLLSINLKKGIDYANMERSDSFFC